MQAVRITTITRQAAAHLTQEGKKAILAVESDILGLEDIPTTGSGDFKAIVGPTVITSLAGNVERLSHLTPVFKPGCDEVTGDVVWSNEEADKFPWNFKDFLEKQASGRITARLCSVPTGVTFPQPNGTVYLGWEGTDVKWFWSAGEPEFSANWVVTKEEYVNPNPETYRITFLTSTKVPPERSLAQDPSTAQLMFTKEGDPWYLPNIFNTDVVAAKAIIAPTFGFTRLFGQFVPIFESTVPTEPTGCVSTLTGPVKLTVAPGIFGFPWVFQSGCDGYTITALASAIPSDVKFPEGGKLYLVWNLANTVQWQWCVDEVPSNVIWTIEKFSRTQPENSK
ncbi:unnamed protein product [Ascophyllum nodosum]